MGQILVQLKRCSLVQSNIGMEAKLFSQQIIEHNWRQIEAASFNFGFIRAQFPDPSAATLILNLQHRLIMKTSLGAGNVTHHNLLLISKRRILLSNNCAQTPERRDD